MFKIPNFPRERRGGRFSFSRQNQVSYLVLPWQYMTWMGGVADDTNLERR